MFIASALDLRQKGSARQTLEQCAMKFFVITKHRHYENAFRFQTVLRDAEMSGHGVALPLS